MVYARRAVEPQNEVGIGERQRPTWAKTGTLDDRLGFLGLQTDVELEAVDVAIELLRCASDLGVRVPFKETGVRCQAVNVKFAQRVS